MPRSLTDCIKSSKFTPSEEKYLTDKFTALKESGLDDIAAGQRAIREFQDENLSTLNNLYAEVGVEDFTPMEVVRPRTEAAPLTQPAIDDKKADIERRREEELDKTFPKGTGFGKSMNELFELGYPKELDNKEGELGERINKGYKYLENKINSKYDAEISALEKQTQQQTSTPIQQEAETGEAVRPGDKLRQLKSKRDTLQANIFGIPIAIYDGLIETIATALDKSTDLAVAIRDAIASIKNKGFDKQGFTKHVEDFIAGVKPRVTVQVGEPATKTKFNFFKNRDLQETGIDLRHLSAETIEVSGEPITQPFDYDKKTLDGMIEVGKRWMAEAKQQFNANAAEYAVVLLKDLKAMTGRMAVKAVAMVNLLNSIDNDLNSKNLSDGERDVLRAVRTQLVDEIADNAREGSLTLNAQRLIHKLYNGEYKFTETMASIVTDIVQKAADAVATKLKQPQEEVSEKVREQKRKKDKQAAKPEPAVPKPKKAKPEKKTSFFENALSKTSKENISKLKQKVTDLANKVKCGGGNA